MRLAGKVAVITGAGSGIGRASALLFAQEGARLCLVDKDGPAVGTVAAEVRAVGGEVMVRVGDVGAPGRLHRGPGGGGGVDGGEMKAGRRKEVAAGMPTRADRQHAPAGDFQPPVEDRALASLQAPVVPLERVSAAEAVQQVGGVVGLRAPGGFSHQAPSRRRRRCHGRIAPR